MVDNVIIVKEEVPANIIISTDGSKSLSGLSDVLFTSLQTGDFINWNGVNFVNTSSTSVVNWGDIIGTLSNQTDLQNALDLKADTSTIPTLTSDLTNDSVVNSVVAGTNVTVDNTDPRNPIVSSIDNVGAVDSVNGQTGVVTLDTADIPEDTNLYYTETRVNTNTNVSQNTTHRDSDGKSHSDVVLANDHRANISNPHKVTLEQARSELNQLNGDIDFNDNSIVDIKGIGFKDGQEITWNPDDYTACLPTGLGPINNLGQETFIVVYNSDATETISNGKCVYSQGVVNNRPSIFLAQADSHDTMKREIYVTTMDIPPLSYGIVTKFGKVNDINTNNFTEGARVYLSPDTAGDLTSTKPEFPNYVVRIGGVFKKDAINGILFVDVDGKPSDTFDNFWNGTIRETIDFTVDSDGTTITGSLAPDNGQPNLTLIFSDGFTTFIATPAATITLTPGTDTIPQINYIYIPKSTKVLTVSTSTFPTEEHIKIATISVRSALNTQTYGALMNQNWNDSIENTSTYQGHLSHITERMRQENAKWDSGVEGTLTTDGTDLTVSTTAGLVYQLHKQIFPALDTATGDNINIVNNFASPYVAVTNLNTQTLDALGNSLANQSFSFVMWGIQNRSGETPHLMLNLPTGNYAKNAPDDAVNDAENYSVYDIPKQFQSVGFLIARFTLTLDAGGTTWTLYSTEDLRGKIANITAGGGGSSGVSTFSALTDTPSTITADYLLYGNATGTALEFRLPTGGGDVVGPASSTDDNLATFDLTTGKIIQDSGINISAVTANTAKISFDSTSSTRLANTSGTNTGDNAINTLYSGLVSNVTTNLSEGTSTTTTVDVDSSDGTNATLVSASTSRAGLMTKAKFDEVVVNNAKVSYPGSADATELNILDGATLTTTELNYVGGVTSSIQTQIDSKLGLNGGNMTGNIGVKTSSLTTEYDNGNSGTAITIDWALGNAQKITITANTTLTFSNVPTNTLSLSLRIIIDGTGGYTITMPTAKSFGGTLTIDTTASAENVLSYNVKGGSLFVAGGSYS